MEELTRAAMKKLTQGMAEHNKAMAAAKSDEAKGCIVRLFQENSVVSCGAFFLANILKPCSLFVQKTQKQNTTTGLRTCNNILAMTKVRYLGLEILNK